MLSPNRKGKITASSAGAILGCDPYRKPIDVMREMVREWNGATREFNGNIATEYGEKCEPIAKAAYEIITGNIIEECDFCHSDWIGATPDGLIPGGVLEIKNPFGIKNDDFPKFKSIKEMPHYYAQVQVQMFCTDTENADFFQYHAKTGTYALEHVQRDSEWITENIPKLQAFFESYLVEREAPQCFVHLDPKIEKCDDKTLFEMCQHYETIAENIKELEQKKKDLLDEIVDRMDHKPADIGHFKLRMVERKGSVKYAEVVKKHLPDLDLEPYTGPNTKYFTLK